MKAIEPRIAGKVAVTAVAAAALLVRARWPQFLPSDAVSIGLLIAAVLPWLDSLIRAAELPGGWKIEFRELQEKVAAQQDVINSLVKYSMSASIFAHLCGVALLRRYNYTDDEQTRREFYFLRDNGLIQPKGPIAFLDFGQQLNGRNIVEVAEPTPIGWECVKLRRRDIPSSMLADAVNLRNPVDKLGS